MEYKHNFGSTSSNSDVDFKDEFHELYNDGCDYIALSKDEYQCFLGSKTIYYRLGVEILDGNEFESATEDIAFTTMHLIPSFRSMHKEKRKSIADCCGIDEDYYSNREYSTFFQDAMAVGMTVIIANERRKYNDFDAEVSNIMNDIASVCPTITGLIGFYLDRYVNRIGYTGWDYLRIYCNNVKDKTILNEKIRQYKKKAS